jgi:hypothetical protein
MNSLNISRTRSFSTINQSKSNLTALNLRGKAASRASRCLTVSSCFLRSILLAMIGLAVPMAWATTPAATVTTVGVSSSTVAAGGYVTVTGTVTSSGVPVTKGQVALCANAAYACNPSLAFAVLPLSSSGTASAKFYAVGQQSFSAGYVGTAAYAASNSGGNPTNVTFTNNNVPTTMAVTSVTQTSTAGTPAGNTQNVYSLVATVTTTSMGTTDYRPTAASSFYDTSNISSGQNYLLGSVTGVEGIQTDGLGPGVTLTAGNNPKTLVTGDFNNDGHYDLAIVNTTDGTVSILLGNGDGTFQAAVNYNVGVAPEAIIAGDFNLDGNLDLAVVNNTSKTIGILLGTGTGTFAPQVTYATGNNPVGIGMGDLNGDGYPDLVVLNQADKTVGVLLNSGTGTGTFAPQVTYATGNNPTSIAVGVSDLPNVTYDNIADVAVTNAGDNTVTVMLGKGDGTLLAPTSATTFAAGNGATAAIFYDVANGGYQSLSWLNATDSTMTIIAAQFDASVYAPANYNTTSNPVALTFADLIVDEGPTPVVLDSSGNLSVYAADLAFDGGFATSPYETFATPQAGATALVAGDYNGDGVPDITVGGTSSVPAMVELQQQTFLTNYSLANVTVAGNSTSNVIATYPGEAGGFLASSTAPVVLTDSPVLTVTTLAISPTPGYYAPGQVVTMTAAMTPTSVGNYVPTGSFEFFDGTTVVCASVPIASSSASCSTGALPISHNVFTAEYLGDTYFASSTSTAKVVNIANVTTTALTLSSSSVVLGTAVLATATVTQSTGGATVNGGVVNFCSTTACAGTALLGTTTLQSANGAAPGTAKLNLHLATGSHTIYAEFVGTGQNAPSTSSSEPLTVTGLTQTESITTISSNSTTTPPYTVTVSVAGALPSVVPSGTVTLTDSKNNGYTVRSGTLSGSVSGYTFDSAAKESYPGQGEVNGIVVADVNGDGIADLVYTNTYTCTVAVQLGTGGGSFAAAMLYTLSANPYCGPQGVTVADLNGDGYPDIIVADDGYDFATSEAMSKVYILLGKSNGTFSSMPDVTLDIGDETVTDASGIYPGPNSTVVGDFNQDGIPDLAVATDEGRIYTLQGNGDGTFQAPADHGASSSPNDVYLTGLSALDINGDGFLDLAVMPLNGFLTVLLGRGDGTFQPAIVNNNGGYSDGIGGMAFGDFNGDGKPDAAVSYGSDSVVCVQLGNGDGTFTFSNSTCSTRVGNPSLQGLAVADFTGDGKLDIAAANYTGGLSIFPGNGDGTLGAMVTFGAGDDNVVLAAGDLNGDGLPDVVLDAQQINDLELFMNRLTLTSKSTISSVAVPGSATKSQHSLVATYAGDTNHTGSVSSGLQVAGTPIPTTTTLSINPSSSQPYGVAEALTATVTPTIASGYSMAGTVVFKDSTTLLTPAGTFNSGSTTSTYSPTSGSFLPVFGSHSYTAVYNVDSVANFKTSTSSMLAFAVTRGTPVITWTPPSKIYTGNTLTSVLTATVPVPGTFTYTATLSGGSPVVVTAATLLSAGSYTVIASFAPTVPADYNTPTPVSKLLTVSAEHLWILNTDASISELDDGGTAVGSNSIIPGGTSTVAAGGIAFDSTGAVWSVSATANQLLNATNTGSSPTPFAGGGLNTPVSLAIDGNGAIWIANSTGSVSEFANTGAAASPATTGYADTSLSTPTGIAIDSSGNVWVSNSGNNSVTEILGAAAPIITPLSVAVHNVTLGTRP